MQKTSPVLCQLDGPVAKLTLNKPNTRNAVDDEMVKLLREHLHTIEKNEAIRVILLSANGNHFCAGADLNYMRRMSQLSYEENLADATALAELFHELSHTSKATVALVHGAVMGGGCGIAACADLVISSEDARFCFSEAKLGLTPATIAPYVLRRLGYQATRRYFITAEPIDSESACELGLVDLVVSLESLQKQADYFIKSICHNSPNAIKQIKTMLHRLTPVESTQIKETAAFLAEIRSSNEAQEGIVAFFEKRSPNWAKGL